MVLCRITMLFLLLLDLFEGGDFFGSNSTSKSSPSSSWSSSSQLEWLVWSEPVFSLVPLSLLTGTETLCCSRTPDAASIALTLNSASARVPGNSSCPIAGSVSALEFASISARTWAFAAAGALAVVTNTGPLRYSGLLL